MNAEKMHKKYGDLYQIMEIEGPFTQKKLKKSYRKLALKYHPDKNSSPNAVSIFLKIKEVFNFLAIRENSEAYEEFLGFLRERKKEVQEIDEKKKFFMDKLLREENLLKDKKKVQKVYIINNLTYIDIQGNQTETQKDKKKGQFRL